MADVKLEKLLKDEPRMQAYKMAIENNKDDFKDKIVLEVGAGIGILSIFAVKSGAKHVYAVECGGLADLAEQVVLKNGFENKITIIKAKIEEAVLPVEKVDIIISDWMGYLLFQDSTLDSVLWARDRYLIPGGKMLPDKAQIFVSVIEAEGYKKKKVGYWQDCYGVNMIPIAQAAIRKPHVVYTEASAVASTMHKVLDLDLTLMKKEDAEFFTDYEIECTRNEYIDAFVMWFDVRFSSLQYPVTLSTSPYKPETRWENVVFFLVKSLIVNAGDIIKGTIISRKHQDNQLIIEMTYSLGGSQKIQVKYLSFGREF